MVVARLHRDIIAHIVLRDGLRRHQLSVLELLGLFLNQVLYQSFFVDLILCLRLVLVHLLLHHEY